MTYTSDISTSFHTYSKYLLSESSQLRDRPVFLSILCTTSIQRICTYHSPDSDTITLLLYVYSSYFLSELSTEGTINYHSRHSVHHSDYPDDIDDTFSALYVLYRLDRNHVTPDLYARILRSLDSIRSSVRPYAFYTWFPYHTLRSTPSIGSLPNNIPSEDNQTSAPTPNETYVSEDIVALSSIVAFFDLTPYPALELKAYVFDTLINTLDKHTDFSQNITFGSAFYHNVYLPLYLCSRITWSSEESLQLLYQINRIAHYHISALPDTTQHTQNGGDTSTHSNAQNHGDMSLLCAAGIELIRRIHTPTIPDHHSQSHITKEQSPTTLNYLKNTCMPYMYALQTLSQKLNIDPEHAPHHISRLYIEKITQDAQGNESIIYASSEHVSTLIAYETAFAASYLHALIQTIESTPSEPPQYTNQQSQLYISSISSVDHSQNTRHITPTNKDIYNSVYLQIHDLLSSLDQDDRIRIRQVLISLSESIDYTIVRDMVMNPHTSPVCSLTHILETHLIGLLGYYLYDKIIDQEYKTIYVPLSIHCIRVFTEQIHHIATLVSTEKSITDCVSEMLNDIDRHYTDELHRSTKDAHHFARKSIGICIIPILLYPQYESCIRTFCTTFQLLRQICDDLSDIRSDTAMRKHTTVYHFRDGANRINWTSIEDFLHRTLQECMSTCNHFPIHTRADVQWLATICNQYISHLKCTIENVLLEHKIRIRMNIQCESE